MSRSALLKPTSTIADGAAIAWAVAKVTAEATLLTRMTVCQD